MRFALLILMASMARPALAEVPVVVTDIPPVHGLVSAVMEGVGAPVSLLPPGSDPHHFSLRPSQADALSKADLIFWIGPNLTPWLEKALGNLPTDATQVELLDQAPEMLELRSGAHDHDHDHHDEDPHAWLDPNAALVWLDIIEARFIEADPENEALYAGNTAKLKQRLNGINERLADEFGSANSLNYMASHDSYQYFEKRYGLSLAGAIANSEAEKPGPKRLTQIRDIATKGNTRCLAIDAHTSPDLIETITADTALKPILIDPLGATIEMGPEFYPNFIEHTAAAFLDCLKESS